MDDSVEELAEELAHMAHGYPYSPPASTLRTIAGRLKADPVSQEGRAMMVGLHIGRFAAVYLVRQITVLDDLIDAAGRAEEAYGTRPCPAPGEHQHPEFSEDLEENITMEVKIMKLIGNPETPINSRVPGVREAVLQTINCPGFLETLATETVQVLTDARKRFDEPAAGTALDERYLTQDGLTNFDALLTDVELQQTASPNPTAQNAAVWAAHRLLGDAPVEERAPLALAVAYLAQHCFWGLVAPGVAALYNRALKTFDLAALDRPCPHTDGHNENSRRITRYARALSSPAENGDESEARCPRHVADYVHEMIRNTEDYLSSGQG